MNDDPKTRDLPPLARESAQMFADLGMYAMEKSINSAYKALISSSSDAIAGQSSSSLISLISCSQSDSKRTALVPCLRTSCIAHSNPSASAWSGDTATLSPCAPNRIGMSYSSYTKPIPTLSLSFIQNASV
ncbi:hypothetical protein F2Q69_00051363 [Brassica cretica]|uniref:Uncharacterized protein n=1 Tax=Brassica cretica TaxID=69181 RepID=A0A8S9PRK6_BRACR|nr:hypothetical protein F2Q69_00051363 [Brassica cretica]